MSSICSDNSIDKIWIKFCTVYTTQYTSNIVKKKVVKVVVTSLWFSGYFTWRWQSQLWFWRWLLLSLLLQWHDPLFVWSWYSLVGTAAS